jgi:HEPN domain-containing protein
MADLAHAQRLWRQVCFHSQQAAEKALKGLLVERVGAYPKSHSLEQLLLYDATILVELTHIRESCRRLDRFYSISRYPDALPGTVSGGEPESDEADEALRDANMIIDEVERRLG